MAQISERITTTNRAPTLFIRRARVFTVARVFYIDATAGSEQLPVAGVASGKHAVEHIDSRCDGFNDVFRRSHPHQITRTVRGHPRRDVRDDFHHRAFFFAHRKPAYGIAIESDFDQSFEASLPEVCVDAALIDSEKSLPGVDDFDPGSLRFSRVLMKTREMLFRSSRPSDGQFQRLGGLLSRGRMRRAFIESHHDIRPKCGLNLHGFFRREHVARPIDVRLKLDPLFAQFAERAEAEDLKTSAVCEYRPIPRREAMQSSQTIYSRVSRSQIKMISVRENDRGSGTFEHFLSQSLDRRLRAYGHKGGRQERPVRGCDSSGAGARPSVDCDWLKRKNFSHSEDF